MEDRWIEEKQKAIARKTAVDNQRKKQNPLQGKSPEYRSTSKKFSTIINFN